MAKASNLNGSDDEERRLGEQTGVDTRVVLAVNPARLVWLVLWGQAVPERRC